MRFDHPDSVRDPGARSTGPRTYDPQAISRATPPAVTLAAAPERAASVGAPAGSRAAAAVALALTVLVGGACAPEEARSGDGDGSMRASARGADSLTLADSLEHWYALGWNGWQLCSGLWTVGRDYERTPEQVVAEDMAPFPHFHWDEDYAYEVDEAARTVTVRAPGVDARTARYNGDQGCALLPAGDQGLYFEPVDVPSSLPDPATQEWPTGDRNAEGSFPEVDTAAIEATLDWAFDDEALEPDQNTRGVVVVYRGKILAERYADGWGPHTPQLSWSEGKSIAAALTGVMIQRGFYGLDDPAPVEEWRGEADPRRDIRIRHLLNMSSGLDFDYMGIAFLGSNEHLRIYFDALDAYLHGINQPLRFEPGSTWRYRNSDPLTLMLIARRTLEAEGEDFLTFPQRWLFDRIGARSFVLETDAFGNFLITGRDYGSTRDWARFGLLHLWDGVWEGERILPEGWREFVSSPAPGDPNEGYGGLFWLNRGGRADRIPADAFWASGHMGQTTMIIPSRDMVIARQGPSAGENGAYMNRLVGEILEAVGRPAEAAGGGEGP